MITVPENLLPYLFHITQGELTRQKAVEQGIRERDDWPAGFDPNDIGIYETVLGALTATQADPHHALKLEGEDLYCMLKLIPIYLRNSFSIPYEDYIGLFNFLKQHAPANKPAILNYIPSYR